MSETPDEDAINARHNAKMKVIQAARARMMGERQEQRGLVIVNTGPGKGKSTAAFGMAARMIGHGRRVSVIQFIKGAMETGEKAVFDAFPDHIEFRPMGEGFTWDTQDRARDIAVARVAWEAAKARLLDPNDWDMVICDELNIVLRYEYLPLQEVLDAIAAKPLMKHFVITGRNAPQELIDAADLVTEMNQVKHPFRSGVKAQAGVEF
ncbi:cob(I)yrinic acid a,c-diamide adenosyltransferase [Caulobacter segnis]|uniref:cob(I)yrinic acid a,c-diamide adenosyltransferase n=1 Tax=Caulobacter segnis TaxID=88688 RepID=UPI00240EA0CB|nr:cob(I)yrinic acid a,c-diamide adenosyltransferase [Caulobacter segnis]MDG2522105.1 cob(I)yrinic acid a,c-diamide adenosyltransferase [Caulobacter segnis]